MENAETLGKSAESSTLVGTTDRNNFFNLISLTIDVVKDFDPETAKSILNNLGKMLFRESRGFEELIGFAGKFTSGLEGEKKGFLISGIASGMARQIFGIEGDPSDEQRVAFKAQVAVNESFLTRSLQVQSQAATPPPVIR